VGRRTKCPITINYELQIGIRLLVYHIQTVILMNSVSEFHNILFEESAFRRRNLSVPKRGMKLLEGSIPSDRGLSLYVTNTTAVERPLM